jgi:hypothetical protein
MYRSLLLLLLASEVFAYRLVDNFHGSSFFGGWDFYGNRPDPTHGYVRYTTRDEATNWQLIKVAGDRVIIAADSTRTSSGSGRASVKITTKKSYNGGLFVIDLNHMPEGCGTWPAFWTVGPNWPYGGEIDIIEGVNNAETNHATLHTGPGCDMSIPRNLFTGRLGHANCNGKVDGNAGCGIAAEAGTYGAPLNRAGGGVYATMWNNATISVWFWHHDRVPADLKSNSPNPSAWGLPFARFQFGSNCPSSHFHDQRIIINLTFCGDWAGAVFSRQCPGLGSCNSYVQNHPQAFANAYWDINYVKVFQ